MAKNSRDPFPIKVLIVDDEQLVRKGLRMTINWEEHQMVVVDDAANGSIGWQKFLEHQPQLVITDIVMPEMTGIELAQKIRKEAPETAILFLSCHRDFDYAQHGIQLGVHDYIVKTDMDDDHINDSLNRVYLQFEEQLTKQQTAVDLVKEHRDQTREAVEAWLSKHSYEAREYLLERVRTKWNWMQSYSCLIHMYIPRDSTNSMGINLNQWKDMSITNPNQLMLLELDEYSAFIACTPALQDLVRSKLVDLKLMNTILEWRQSKPIVSAEDWMDSLSRLYRMRLVECNTNLLSLTHKEDIILAIDFIDEHLDTDIRAADVAANIGVSRSYFSTIFKEATGYSIISFISDRKLQRAKELLSVTTIRIEEVAEKIGIQDVKYFSKWFKKHVEITPGQYRLQTK